MAITKEHQEFIERVGALAAADMKKSGVLASLTIAQAILESGWGKSGLTVKANALFGIKAGKSWKGKVYSAQTQECYDGATFTMITALFRAYDSWAESVADHSALLTGAARYKAVIGERDYKTACRAIKAAGYATDPQYADKLIQIVENYSLTVYDGAESATAPAGRPGASGGSNDTGGTESPANGKGTGKLKLAAVSDWIYQRIPAVLKLLFSEKDIEKLIESALEEAKKAWGTNGNLAAYIDEYYYMSIPPQETEKIAEKLNAEPGTILPGT